MEIVIIRKVGGEHLASYFLRERFQAIAAAGDQKQVITPCGEGTRENRSDSARSACDRGKRSCV
jgi:hypothetical protein